LLQQALAHHQAGRLPAAAALYTQLRTLAPRTFDPWHLGGVAALQLGQLPEAVQLLTRALALNARSATTHMCLGLALASLGRNVDAEIRLREAVRLAPANHEAWTHLASVLVISGRLDEAADCYQRTVKLKPDYAQGWSGLGSVLQLQNRNDEAILHHSRALELDQHHPKARLARAQALQSTHRLQEALNDFDAHLARNPDDLEARSYRLLLLNYSSDIPRETLFAEHVAFGRQASANAARRPPAPATPAAALSDLPHRKLSIAFLSPDLRTHSIAYFVEPLLRHLDRERFEITLYHDHFVSDETTARLKTHAARFRNFIGLSADVVESQIRADAPDILIDLAGHTGLNRLPLYARRLAPVQINYLGYPATTGLREMDFRFTDALADPVGKTDAFHTEQLIRFAPTAWTYAPPAGAPAPAPPPSTRGGPFTFGSFNNLSKLSAATLRLWSAVLAAVPGSRLALKSFGLSRERLLPQLAAAGISTDRVELLAAPPALADHLALYSHVDVALDPFPYHGTTTTCEALWMGVPVITLAGDRHATRVGVSLLTAASHPELVALTGADYVSIAQRLASDSAALTALRSRLRDDLARSPLLDHAAQTARFGDALLACWEKPRASSAASTLAPAVCTP